MKNLIVPYRVREIADLERMASRLHAGGVADTIAYQLDEDLLLDTRCGIALRKAVDQIHILLEQSYFLEQKLDAMDSALNAEKRLSLELRVEKQKYLENNARLQKENRNLKREIDKMMSNGGRL